MTIKRDALLALERRKEQEIASLQSDLEAIRRTRRMLEQRKRQVEVSVTRNGQSQERAPAGDVNRAVKNALVRVAGKFTGPDLDAAIEHKFPRSSVRAALKRMNGKLVKIVTAGRGRRATIYEKLNRE